MSMTVLLTGISGYIGRATAADLLRRGHTVRGSVRDRGKDAGVRDAILEAVPGAEERLSFVTLDLSRDAGWHDAMQGVDALVHTASPFPFSQPDDPQTLIRPAVDGTLRALKAAAETGVSRVVLTSSMIAVMHLDAAAERPVTEADWSEPDHPTLNAYGKSKTLAEKAAWDFAAAHPAIDLVVINPGLVVGPPVGGRTGSSMAVVKRILDGGDPLLPDITFPVVALDDVAALHAEAVTSDAMVGHRHLAAADTRSMPQIGRLLAPLYPDRRIATRRAPKWLLRFLSMFDGSIGTVLPSVGIPYRVDASATCARTGRTFTPADDAIRAAAAYLTAA